MADSRHLEMADSRQLKKLKNLPFIPKNVQQCNTVIKLWRYHFLLNMPKLVTLQWVSNKAAKNKINVYISAKQQY